MLARRALWSVHNCVHRSDRTNENSALQTERSSELRNRVYHRPAWRMLGVGEEYFQPPSRGSLTKETNPELWSLEVGLVNPQAQVGSLLSSRNREASDEAAGQLKAAMLANESVFAREGAPPGR
ncbi:hypothetical protein PHET_12107 [Paragonimus heterotremus]|uniref:Uncharacterized protein n=1 Tax=Paragonimus heterotremus TaxID=100268 RepID=A0A8J4SKN8_9TREM|nr:hypothetical protein PHET_12107 [Paragonimus heterotremus]